MIYSIFYSYFLTQVLSQFPFSKTEKPFELLSEPEAIKSMAIVLQRGSIEGRFYAMEMLQQISKKGYDWNSLTKHQIIDLFKSILELASDEIIKKASAIKTTDSSIVTHWYSIIVHMNIFILYIASLLVAN